MTLDELRNRIDDIDKQIVDLLNARAEAAIGIGKIKQSTDAVFYVPEREKAVYKRLAEHNEGPMPDAAVKSISWGWSCSVA